MPKLKTLQFLIGTVVAGTLQPSSAAMAQTAVRDSARAHAYHLLNRITFGPKPGDVDQVLAMGIDQFIARQLDPFSIPDTVLNETLIDSRILNTTTETLAKLFRERRQARIARQRAGGDTALGSETRRMTPTDPGNVLGRLLAEYPKITLTRAVQSERQLYEVMVDFWTNHFNVYSAKGPVRYLLPEYIEETIRPYAFGRFEDLLIATAQSPAMLVYLDNVQSVAVGSEPPQLANMERRLRRARQVGNTPARRAGSRARQVGNRGRRTMQGSNTDNVRRAEERMARVRERLPSGPNENYARELLELHTLGVDGGYTQQDVVDVARIFTGWSMGGRTRQDPSNFVFNAWAHDTDKKTVIGHDFPANGGMTEGVELLHILATHPSTIRHISSKLCTRFVLDVPPDGCIDTAAQAWMASDGNISVVVGAIIESPGFWASAGQKIKTPLEFVVSAVRAVDGVPDTTLALPQVVRRLGQPLYGAEAPTGYPETKEDWVNAGALLGRFNIALGFASGRIPGVQLDLDQLIPVEADLEDMLDAANQNILQGTASEHTLNVWRNQARERPPSERRVFIIGLAIGSPEFQRQ